MLYSNTPGRGLRACYRLRSHFWECTRLKPDGCDARLRFRGAEEREASDKSAPTASPFINSFMSFHARDFGGNKDFQMKQAWESKPETSSQSHQMHPAAGMSHHLPWMVSFLSPTTIKEEPAGSDQTRSWTRALIISGVRVGRAAGHTQGTFHCTSPF